MNPGLLAGAGATMKGLLRVIDDYDRVQRAIIEELRIENKKLRDKLNEATDQLMGYTATVDRIGPRCRPARTHHRGGIRGHLVQKEAVLNPCTTCLQPVNIDGAKLCDACWEVEYRLDSYLHRGQARARQFVAHALGEALNRSPPLYNIEQAHLEALRLIAARLFRRRGRDGCAGPGMGIGR
jgi:hypothetical protein